MQYLKRLDQFRWELAAAPDETDTPILTIHLPASLKFNLDFGVNGLAFATGISYRLTTGVADNDTGAVAAAAVLAMNISYT